MPPRDRDEETETPEDVPEGTEPPSGEETSEIDSVKFKSYIDDRLDSLIRATSYSNKPDFGPETESKVFKRETESNKFKFKGNHKHETVSIQRKDRVSQRVHPRTSQEKRYEGAKRGINNVINQSRQKLIKLADKNKGGWLVVEEYEQEELAEDSDDE